MIIARLLILIAVLLALAAVALVIGFWPTVLLVVAVVVGFVGYIIWTEEMKSRW